MRLPVYPALIEGEVLSSYVIRLAVANRLRPMRLTVLLGLKTFWKRDPDVNLTFSEVLRVAEAAGLPPERVWACSVRPMTEALHGEVRPDVQPRYVVMPGKHRGVEDARGVPICVACVRETGAVLRAWRLTTSVLCERHGLPLVDVCPSCGSAVNHIRPHLAARSRVVAYRPDYCWHCERAYPLPEALAAEALAAAGTVQRLMDQAVMQGEVDWHGLRLPAGEFQAVLESVLRQHYPLRAVTGMAKWRPETASVQERLRIVIAGGEDIAEGLTALLVRWRSRGVLPHQVCSLLGLPERYADLVRAALSRDARQFPPMLSGRQTFCFTERQWRIVSRVLPPVPCTSRHGHPVRQILRAWFTKSLRGIRQTAWTGAMTGQVSYPAMYRRIRQMAADGTLDLVIEVMLAELPELRPFLTAPAVVCSLHQLGSCHAEHLWHLMVEDMVGAWCEPAGVQQHGGRVKTTACLPRTIAG